MQVIIDPEETYCPFVDFIQRLSKKYVRHFDPDFRSGEKSYTSNRFLGRPKDSSKKTPSKWQMLSLELSLHKF